MRLANEVVALVIEGGIEEEAVVVQLEMPAVLPDAALPERQQLLAFGKRTDCDGPFFERDWHESLGTSRFSTLRAPSANNCPPGQTAADSGVEAQQIGGKSARSPGHFTFYSHNFKSDRPINQPCTRLPGAAFGRSD
jgi:hypothetical protein